MTCDTARLLIHFARPGAASDLAPDDRLALDAHLAACPHCQTEALAHHLQDSAIAVAMRAVPIPIGFRDALQTQAIATRNGLWRTRWIRRVSATAALAASLMLGYGVVANVVRPSLNSDTLLSDFDTRGSSALDAEEWCRTERLPQLPEDFDLRLTTFAGRLSLEGRIVPALRLQAGNGHDAMIYFVRDSQFRLAETIDAIGSQGSVRVFRNQPGGWTIVVLHSGNTLAPFLRRPGSSV